VYRLPFTVDAILGDAGVVEPALVPAFVTLIVAVLPDTVCANKV